MPRRRESAEHRRRHRRRRRCVATTPAIISPPLNQPRSADLLESDPRAQQRDAEAQDPPRGKVDARLGSAFAGDAIERHAEQQRVEQRRSAAMLGDERRGDRDDGAEQRARPAGGAIRRASRATDNATDALRCVAHARGSVREQLADEFFGPRPFAVSGGGIEVADRADVRRAAAPRLREVGDAIEADPADRWCSRRRCSETAAGARGVGSQPFSLQDVLRRIAFGQRRFEIGRRREQRALDRRGDAAAPNARRSSRPRCGPRGSPALRSAASDRSSVATHAAHESLSCSMRGTDTRVAAASLRAASASARARGRAEPGTSRIVGVGSEFTSVSQKRSLTRASTLAASSFMTNRMSASGVDTGSSLSLEARRQRLRPPPARARRFARITFLSSLPTLVFGMASTKCTRSGTAYLEIAPRSRESATWRADRLRRRTHRRRLLTTTSATGPLAPLARPARRRQRPRRHPGRAG